MRNKNIPYIISYILALLVVLLGTLFYRQPVLTALLLLMILLPALSLILCSRAKERLEVKFATLPVAVSVVYNDDPDTEKEEQSGNTDEIKDGGLKLKMQVENPGFVPLLNCMLTFRYGNRFYPHNSLNDMVFAAPMRSSESYELKFDASLPGLFEFEAEKLYVTDLLHLKTWEIPFSKIMKTAILPEETGIENIEIKKAALEEDAENSLAGELSREVRQIREYAPGDRLRDMHWKQTARLDEPMVREFERMRESFYVLYPVVEPGKAQGISSDGTQASGTGAEMRNTLKFWYSLALKLIKQGETVYTVIYDADSRTFEKFKSSSEDDLIQTVYAIYCGTEPDFRISDELLGRLREEIPDVAVIRNGKLSGEE